MVGGRKSTTGRMGGAKTRGAAERWRRALPVAFLALSLGVAGFGALEAYRAQRSHSETARTLLQDYSEYAAWSYQRSAWDLLTRAVDGHLSVAYANTQFARGHATDACLRLILSVQDDGCGCGPRLAGGYSFFTRLGEPVSESRWAGASPGSMQQASIVEAVHAHAREAYGEEWRFALLHVPSGGIVAYTLLESPATLDRDFEATRDTVVYGFEVEPDRLAEVYATALLDEVVLPPTLTRDRSNADVLAVQVYGPGDDLLYSSAPPSEMAFAAPVPREEIFGGGEIRASVMPEIAGELIIGGLPKDRTGVLLLVVSLAGALACLAILQIRREDELARLRQDFVASVSHELRTPLAQVRLFTETLKLGRTRTPEQRGWALDNIDRETLRLANLVENVLHFSRSERGVLELDREVVDLSGGLREAIASFEPLLPARKVRIEVDIVDGLVAEAHLDSLRQVVLNLLDNAVRYGPSGQTIRVAARRVDGHVRVTVDDEGPGVPAEERERIFEPFRRGDQSVGTVVVGSGIGLAVVRQIVESHEGSVGVVDAPGGGARFVVEIPAVYTATAGDFGRAEESRRTGVA